MIKLEDTHTKCMKLDNHGIQENHGRCSPRKSSSYLLILILYIKQ